MPPGWELSPNVNGPQFVSVPLYIHYSTDWETSWKAQKVASLDTIRLDYI